MMTIEVDHSTTETRLNFGVKEALELMEVFHWRYILRKDLLKGRSDENIVEASRSRLYDSQTTIINAFNGWVASGMLPDDFYNNVKWFSDKQTFHTSDSLKRLISFSKENDNFTIILPFRLYQYLHRAVMTTDRYNDEEWRLYDQPHQRNLGLFLLPVLTKWVAETIG